MEIHRRRSGKATAAVLAMGVALLASREVTAEQRFAVKNIREIKTSGSGVNYVKPRWSPDGSMLAFETVANRERRLYVHVVDGDKTFEVLSKKETSARIGDAASVPRRAVANFDATWSERSSTLVHVGSGTAGHFGLYSVLSREFLSDEWKKKDRYEPFAAGSQGDPYVAFPDYHPGSKTVVYSQGQQSEIAGGGRLDLHLTEVAPPDRSKAAIGRLLVTKPADADLLAGVPQLEPSFSRSGTQIVFTGIKRGNNDIYTIGVDNLFGPLAATTPVKRLTDWPSPEGRPAWSPDDKQIAFLSGRDEDEEEWGLWVMGADGGTPKRLAARVLSEDNPEWHRNGEFVFFVKVLEEKQNPIHYVNVQSREVFTLKMDTRLHTHLDISDDGTRLAVCARGRASDSNLTWLKLYVADLELTNR